ncbi:radical SAM/SPASM domain-containing protein [Desulfobulbus alkaliphilus]|uniref:radical SAM/SPASM domain-containing protein n=1 Tax=Desulfobulbus alkaliphilus TaxID=869814 RepID=UPI001963ADA8|nr:radical SAM protein [Desulfobulbus alkaliphilus]
MMIIQSNPDPAHLEQIAHNRQTQINYLILVLTRRCNLQCASCYHGSPDSQQDMSIATLEKAFDLAIAGSGPLHIQLTGGEPTLVPELIEAAAQRALIASRPCTMGIQTNGTCLDAQTVALLKRYRIQVGVSLDGPPAIQEEVRGKSAETLRGLQLLESCALPFRLTTVISNRNVAELDRLALLLAGFRQAMGLGLDLLVVKGNAREAATMLPAPSTALIQGVSSLARTLTIINQRKEIPLQLRELELVKGLLNAKTKQVNRTRNFCYAQQGTSLAVHPDGRLFPCGQSLGDPRLFAGSVDQAAPMPLFPQRTLTELAADCSSCPLENKCPGDCPSRLHYNRDHNPLLACDLYRTLAYSLNTRRLDSCFEYIHPQRQADRRGASFPGSHPCHP